MDSELSKNVPPAFQCFRNLFNPFLLQMMKQEEWNCSVLRLEFTSKTVLPLPVTNKGLKAQGDEMDWPAQLMTELTGLLAPKPGLLEFSFPCCLMDGK